MRSFIKSHTKAQSSGASEIQLEDTKSGANSVPLHIPLSIKAKSETLTHSLSPPTTLSSVPLTPTLTSSFRPGYDSRSSSASTTTSPRHHGGSSNTMFSTGSASGLITAPSSSSLKKLNPMSYIRRRRASTEGHDYVPSAKEYKEAGSIFGTRTHDWGSTPSTSPSFQSTPVCSPLAANFNNNSTSNTTPNHRTNPSSPISPLGIYMFQDDSFDPSSTNLLGTEHISSTMVLEGKDFHTQDGKCTSLDICLFNENSKENHEVLSSYNEHTVLDLLDLKKELSTMIRETKDDGFDHPGHGSEIINQNEAISTPALSIEKLGSYPSSTAYSPANGTEDEYDTHSEFSFEEEARMGRSTSIKYHKPSVALYTDEKPSYQLEDYTSVAGYYSEEEEFLDLYNYDCDAEDGFREDDGHLFGMTSLDTQVEHPYLKPANSLGSTNLYELGNSVAPLRLSTQFSDNSDVEYMAVPSDEEEKTHNSNFRANNISPMLHLRAKVQPATLVDGTSFELDGISDDDEYYNYDNLLDEVNAITPDLDDQYDSETYYLKSAKNKSSFGLRRAKSYSFESHCSRPQNLRRQSSVIKFSDAATVTLFSSSSSLSKTSSTSSSASVPGSISSSSSILSTENLTAAEIAELSYGSLFKDLPQPSLPGRSSLTPISERSYDSDYSPIKQEHYDF